MKARPRSPFKHRRPASARLESVESVAFRRLMYEEHAAEARREHAHDLEAFALISSAGFDPLQLDMDRLIAVSGLEGVVAC
jgi:hypothetical protein